MNINIENKRSLNIKAFKALDEGNPHLGVELFKRSLLIDKSQPEIIYSLAILLTQLNIKSEAINLYQKAITLKEDYVDAIYNLALLFYDLKRFDESLEMFNQALSIETSAEVYNNKGLVLKDLKRFDESLEMFNQALSIETSAEVYNNKGLVLKDLKRFDDAIKSFKAAISLNSQFALAYVEIAGIFFRDGLRNLSVENYKKALIADPQLIEAHVGLGLIYLSEKKFKEGWDFYGHRVKMPDAFMMSPRSNKPLLNEINNDRLLIVAEQGIGDHILYMSLIQDFYSIHKYFDVSVNPKLISILNRSFKNINFISSKVNIDDSVYSYQLPMGCIGNFTRPTPESFRTQPKKFLYADETLKDQLRFRLKEDGKFLCGIAWKSKNEDIGEYKSINLETLLPIIKLNNITFVNLQYGDTQNEIETVKKLYGIDIKTIDEIDNFNDIDGLASLIDACDFVVSASNVTIHLAGGLGKQSYLIVPDMHGRIWYWHKEDSQSIWYPSVSIHSQIISSSWSKPINDIAQILENKKLNE